MIFRTFAVYDSKAACYFTPFFFPNAGQAIRSFMDEANRAGSMMNKHPADYTLFELGTYDDATGLFAQPAQPVNHGQAASFLRAAEVVDLFTPAKEA